MSDAANSNLDPGTSREQAAIRHTMRRLEGFARGLGLSEAATRRIVKKVVADMPLRTDEERLIEVRARMVATAD